MRLRTWAVVTACVALSACARRSTTVQTSDASEGGSSGSGGTGGTGGGHLTTIPHRDLSDASFTYNGPLDDGSVDRDAACVSASVPALPIALDMYLILDRSLTMALPLGGIPTCKVGNSVASRWCYSINALGGFFAAPTSNGLGVALDFFPHGACGWVTYPTDQNCCVSGDCCQGTLDADPSVPLGELPGQLSTLIEALNAQKPLGSTTPIEAALRGLTRYTESAKRPDRQMVGVIVTDGEPAGCEADTGKLSAILTAHRASAGQLTFVIGMTGAKYEVLEALATAGGAPPHTTHCAGNITPCSFYDVGDGNPEAFVDALQQIQRSVVGCRFGMPMTDAGIIDPNTLAVEWQSSRQSTPTRIPRVDSAAACGDGWYADPSRAGEFSLCPTTCTLLQTETQVNINVLAGCLGS